MESYSSIISPRSMGIQKKFEFESQNAQDYIDTLEENLNNHAKIIKDIFEKIQGESFTEDSETEIKSQRRLNTIISEIIELYKSLKEVEAERKTHVSKVLVNELLEHEHKEKLDDITMEYEERIQEIKFHIDRKDKIIYDIQKHYTDLETQVNFKTGIDEVIYVDVEEKLLRLNKFSEGVREFIFYIEERTNYGNNLKKYLEDFYKSTWRKVQILQALLRNPVNIKEGCKRPSNLMAPENDFDNTLELDESEIEIPDHIRSHTEDDKLIKKISSCKRKSLSSGQEVIENVISRLIIKVEKTQKKLQKLESEYQILNEILCKENEDNFNLKIQNSKLVRQYIEIKNK